jgi:hypothetical protein
MPIGLREAPGRSREKPPVHRAKLRTANLSTKHFQLVTEHQDLDVLRAIVL